jgi:hypothetical protein
MATIQSLVDRVRLELGDLGKSFVTQFVADGSTNRFRLHYAPLDAPSIVVYIDGEDFTSSASVEESTGVLVMEEVPADGAEMIVSGNYYRYFTNAELQNLVTDAVAQHSNGQVDAVGRKLSVETLLQIDEYPVSIYAVTLALYTLATDASFDIDISAPDGVSIPRAERYRQLMDMVQARQAQYRDLCVQLGLGMYKIEVFSLRRTSKATGRYVPVYRPQEVDDRSFPQRVDVPMPTYGDKPVAWVTDAGSFTAYQGRAFTTELSWDFDPGQTFTVVLQHQRSSRPVIMRFEATIEEVDEGQYTATISLTDEQTFRLAERTYWSVRWTENDSALPYEVKGGNFFTVRSSQVVI